MLSNWAIVDLSPESEIDFVIEKAKLRNIGNIIPSTGADCKAEGLFVINCTSFEVCVAVGGGIFFGAEATCALGNFNPSALQCDPDYVCPQCTKAGFICLSHTSFRYCSDVPEVVVNNVTCPTNHYCNEVCKHPCLKSLNNC